MPGSGAGRTEATRPPRRRGAHRSRRKRHRKPGSEPTEPTEPTPAAEAPRGEDEEAMVTANPPMPDIAAPESPTRAEAPAGRPREVTGLPALDEPGGAPNEAAGELPLPAGDRDRQPEGRRGQDHDRGQPRGRARRSRLPRARGRPRSAGQRVDRPRDQPPRRGVVGLRRDHDRRPRPRLRRAHEPQEPLRAPGHHRPRGRRDRAGRRPSAASSSSVGRSTRSAPSTTSSSSTARPRSGCSPSTGWPPPTT